MDSRIFVYAFFFAPIIQGLGTRSSLSLLPGLFEKSLSSFEQFLTFHTSTCLSPPPFQTHLLKLILFTYLFCLDVDWFKIFLHSIFYFFSNFGNYTFMSLLLMANLDYFKYFSWAIIILQIYPLKVFINEILRNFTECETITIVSEHFYLFNRFPRAPKAPFHKTVTIWSVWHLLGKSPFSGLPLFSLVHSMRQVLSLGPF